MKIFCTGLQRTGTTSITEALTLLGFKTNHYPKGLRSDINHKEIRQYDAFTDWPIPIIYAELDRRHPGSKFIHLARNEDDWLQSVEWLFTVGAIKYGWPKSGPGIDLHTQFYGTDTFEPKKFLAAYRKHNKNVIEYFATRPDDFLALQLEEEEKFEKICDFLSLPVPEVPFPCANQKEHYLQVRLRQLRSLCGRGKRRMLKLLR